MFFAPATRSARQIAVPARMFARDLTASLATIGALGALLALIQTNSTMRQTAMSAMQPATQKVEPAAHQARTGFVRQPSDEAAIPDGDEERIAQAMVAFALSKVSPLHPEPMLSIPSITTPLALTITPPRLPTGLGQVGFAQAEWPMRIGEPRFSATPRDQQTLVASTRAIPRPERLMSGAQWLAGGARKTVSYGVGGLRNGLAAAQQRAASTAAALW